MVGLGGIPPLFAEHLAGLIDRDGRRRVFAVHRQVLGEDGQGPEAPPGRVGEQQRAGGEAHADLRPAGGAAVLRGAGEQNAARAVAQYGGSDELAADEEPLDQLEALVEGVGARAGREDGGEGQRLSIGPCRGGWSRVALGEEDQIAAGRQAVARVEPGGDAQGRVRERRGPVDACDAHDAGRERIGVTGAITCCSAVRPVSRGSASLRRETPSLA